MSANLENLLRHPGIWRTQRGGESPHNTLSTGFAELDRALPAGGWPLGALTEILFQGMGAGELRLVMPALARLSREGRWIAWIAPPHIPYAPALAAWGVDLSRLLLVRTRSENDALWAAEQALRSGSCGAVLIWPASVDDRSLRRLQLAAESGECWGLLFRTAHVPQRSPAAVRLKLEPLPQGALVQILKCRGRAPSAALTIDLEMSSLPLTAHECERPATSS